jgi:hypothetical protein
MGLIKITGGGVIEKFGGVCNGQTVKTQNGDIILENVTAVQNLATSYTDITGSSITYTPPTGTKNVIYKFSFLHDRADTNPLSHFKTFLDTDEIVYRRFSIGIAGSYGQVTTHTATFKCDASANDFNTGNLTSWTTSKTIKMQGREYGGTNESKLHETHHWDGVASDQLHIPYIEITALS